MAFTQRIANIMKSTWEKNITARPARLSNDLRLDKIDKFIRILFIVSADLFISICYLFNQLNVLLRFFLDFE